MPAIPLFPAATKLPLVHAKEEGGTFVKLHGLFRIGELRNLDVLPRPCRRRVVVLSALRTSNDESAKHQREPRARCVVLSRRPSLLMFLLRAPLSLRTPRPCRRGRGCWRRNRPAGAYPCTCHGRLVFPRFLATRSRYPTRRTPRRGSPRSLMS